MRNVGRKPLFCYGSFRKTAWRCAILGAPYPSEPATLPGWRRIVLTSGYLSLRKTVVPLPPVTGVIVELDAIGWRIADLWEEVPTYTLVDVVVNTMHGPLDALAYVCGDEEESTPLDGDRLALMRDDEVEAAIVRFEPHMRALRDDNRP